MKVINLPSSVFKEFVEDVDHYYITENPLTENP